MPKFSDRSLDRLATVDPRLYQLFFEVVKDVDCTVLCGHRGRSAQDKAYSSGFSLLKWPQSKHNSIPARAVDVAPWPLAWDDREQFCFLAGWVMRTAKEFGISVRWGGDWNRNMQVADESFSDLCHYELR